MKWGGDFAHNPRLALPVAVPGRTVVRQVHLQPVRLQRMDALLTWCGNSRVPPVSAAERRRHHYRPLWRMGGQQRANIRLAGPAR